MIDLATEDLMSLREVPNYLPRRPNGKKIHLSAIYRWSQSGIRGCKLEVTHIGNSAYTSTQAIQRFADAITATREKPGTTPGRLTRTRQAQAAIAATKVRERLGIQSSSSTPHASRGKHVMHLTMRTANGPKSSSRNTLTSLPEVNRP